MNLGCLSGNGLSLKVDRRFSLSFFRAEIAGGSFMENVHHTHTKMNLGCLSCNELSLKLDSLLLSFFFEQKLIEFVTEYPITLTRIGLECFSIENFDIAAAIANHTSLLQISGGRRNRRAWYSERI